VALGRALGHAIGTQQRERLLTLEPVLLDGAGHRLLLLGREYAQGVGQGHPDSALIETLFQRLTELLGQREALENPAPLSAADLGDGGRPQLFVVSQVPDDPGLVHG